MTASVQKTIFAMVEQYLEVYGDKEVVLSLFSLTSIREKRRFGLLTHRCPLCQEPMHYYKVECKLRSGGEHAFVQPLPINTVRFLASGFTATSAPLFGICPNEHKTARLGVTGHDDMGTILFEFGGDVPTRTYETRVLI